MLMKMSSLPDSGCSMAFNNIMQVTFLMVYSKIMAEFCLKMVVYIMANL